MRRAPGRLQALWAIGYDVYLTNPDATRTREALAALDLLDRPGPVPERDGARARPRVPARRLVVREGRHVHERRAPRPARAARRCRRPAARAPTGRSSATSRARWASPKDSVSDRRGDLGRDPRRLARGRRDHLRAARAAAACSGPVPTEDHPGTTLLHEHALRARPARAPARASSRARRPRRPRADFPFVLMTGRHLLPVQRRDDDRAARATPSCAPATSSTCHPRTPSGSRLQRRRARRRREPPRRGRACPVNAGFGPCARASCSRRSTRRRRS